jgi:flavin-dependent dehydrogenase
VNPLSADLANVMAVSRKDRLPTWSGILDRASPMRVGARVSVGPLAHRVARVVFPGALLVGDASGFVDPFTGQGVYLALRGAQRAAWALSQAYASPSRAAHMFTVYESAIREELQARTRLAAVVEAFLRFAPLGRRVALRLRRSPELSATLLAAVSGQAAARSALAPAFLRRLVL